MPDPTPKPRGSPPESLDQFFPKVLAPGSYLEQSRTWRKSFPKVDTPPRTYLEWTGSWQMSSVLGVICFVTVGLVLSWGSTRPTIQEAQAFAGANADPEASLRVLIQLRDEHFENYRDMFQLVVLSGLVPLFTLLAGYVFGKRTEAVRPGAANENDDSENGS